jgi:hypothetical protein
MTLKWLLVADPESVVMDGGEGLVFSIAFEAIGRDPHEYTRTKSKSGNKSDGLGATQHAPLHRRDRTVLAVKEFFENQELMQKYTKKINQFVMGSDDIIKVPFAELVKTLVDACVKNGGRLASQCVDLDLRSLWFSDRYYGTNLFPNGPYFKVSSSIREWNSLRFVCTRKWFTSQRLNQKMLQKYPEMIDLSLEGLAMTIRKDLSFLQSHRPQDDVDLLIEVLDHVYTAGVSKQDFWDLLNMCHDFYDNKPATIFSPGGTRLCTVGVSAQDSLKN